MEDFRAVVGHEQFAGQEIIDPDAGGGEMADLHGWVCDQGVGVVDSERAREFAGEGAGVVALGIVFCVV